jgi:hypothetical protein
LDSARQLASSARETPPTARETMAATPARLTVSLG